MEENNHNNQVNEPVAPVAPVETTTTQEPAQPIQQTPVTPEAPKKSNIGLIIGIGCGALAIIGLIIAIIVVVVVVIAGGGKAMKCTYSKSTSGCTVNINADLGIRSNRVNSVALTGYVDCAGAAYEETLLSAFETQFKKQTNIINVKREGSRITFDYKDTAGIDLGNIENSKIGITREEAKKKLESAGYVCN